MILSHSDFSFTLDFHDEKIKLIRIYDKKYFRSKVSEINGQIEGEEGNFIISDGNREIPFSKYAHIITDYFVLPISNKKILTKLLSDLSKIANEDINKSGQLIASIEKYLDDIFFDVDYPICRKNDLCIDDIFKIANIEMERTGDLLEDLFSYCRIIYDVFMVRIIFFINLSSILSKNEYTLFINQLYKNKYKAVIIESSDFMEKNNIEFVDTYTVDEDLCEIY